MKRKLMSILCLVLAMLMVFSLTACGAKEDAPAAKEEETKTDAPAASEKEETAESTEETGPARDDLNLALSGVVSTLDPFATGLTIDLTLFCHIYESLYYMDDYSQVHPRLAESHTVSDDGLVYTFTIRQDAYFHNGDQVTADDVVFSFQRALEGGVLASYLTSVEKVEKTGDFEVAITLTQAYTPFLENSTHILIVSQKAYEEAGETFGATITGAGTGPYMLSSYNPNTEIELQAFDKYYRGEASIKKVTYTVMSDASATLIALETGELDFSSIPTANWAEIEGSGEYNTTLNPTSHISYMLINPRTDSPLNNQDVRYAVQYAIDRDAINIVAYEGMAIPAYQFLHPDYVFGSSEDSFHFEYSPEKAKEYLEKAGYPDGVDIGEIQYGTSTYFPKIAQTIQQQLAAVGITCEIVGGETSDLVVGWRAGEYNALISGLAPTHDFDTWRKNNSPEVATAFLKLQDTEYDAEWIKEMYAKGAAEQDPEKRTEIYNELQDYINKVGAYVPVFYKTLPYAWDKDLNVKLDLNWYYIYDWSWNN